MWENLVDYAAHPASRPVNGLPGLIVGLTGGAVMIAQVVQRFDVSTWFALALGTATGVGGLGWQIYCSGHNAVLKECERLRAKIDAIDAAHEARIDAIDRAHEAKIQAMRDEHRKLIEAAEADRDRLRREVGRLKSRVTLITPDPDAEGHERAH